MSRPAIRKQDRSPDKLDRFRMHLLEDRPIKKADKEMLSKYRKANSLLCLGYSRQHVVTVLTKEEKISESQAYAVLRDSIKLYGDINEVEKKGLRQISMEYYKLISNLARKKDDYVSAIRAQYYHDKLAGLFDEETSDIDAKEFMRPVAIFFTTDAEVLKAQQREELGDNENTYAVESE